MSFNFDIYTLVDITNTGAKRNQDPCAYKQYQNYLTVLQTIGLRVNPTVDVDPTLTSTYPKFGNVYKGTQRVWKLPIVIEYEDAIDLEMLLQDFDFVPFIPNLTESTKFETCVFRTTDPEYKNIVFEINDKY
jgi:hypothetical protein